MTCGNDTIEGAETCDGTDLAGQDCTTQGFSGGTLACAGDCSGFDTSACTGPVSNCCVANGTPGCDDATCETAICAVDAFCCSTQWDQICADAATGADGGGNECAACTGPTCGDDLAEDTEVCDGTDLAGEDCVSQGFAGGTLACAADCSGFDTSGCTGPSDCCVANGTPGCDDATCETAICAVDAFCCSTQWDQICADAATGADGGGNECAACSGPSCGDDLVEGTEVCDGTDLAGEDCVSQGFAGGTLACAADCSGFDTSGCTQPSDCCIPNGTPGCDDATCETAICAVDPFCCSTQWDQICTDSATGADGGGNECAICAGPSCGDGVANGTEVCDGADLAGADCVSQGFAGGTLACAADCSGYDTSSCTGPSDCCIANGTPGCDDATCETAICAVDPFCCSTQWDQVCSDAATGADGGGNDCAVCG